MKKCHKQEKQKNFWEKIWACVDFTDLAPKSCVQEQIQRKAKFELMKLEQFLLE